QPPMTVSITGATGFIGRRLVHKLLSDDHKVCILTRSASKAASVFPASTYPGLTIAQQGDWEACVRGSTAVVNLAGMPISTRWSPEIKQEIKQSRVNVTSKVVKYINHAGNADTRPSVFVSATAIGYYGTSEIHSFDESSPSGNDYLAEVCREWEATACQVNQEDVRLVLLRIGVVLGKDGGALAKMIPLFMMFAGGPLGTGRQWFSWIHLDDLVNLIYESLTNPTYKGVINGTAPNPVRLSELCERLGRIVGRPSWLPVPGFALKAVLGEGASVELFTMARVYVGNLDSWVTSGELEDEFRVFGVLRSANFDFNLLVFFTGCLCGQHPIQSVKLVSFTVIFDFSRDLGSHLKIIDCKNGWRVELSRNSSGRGGRDRYGGSESKCYECGETGHFARECRLRIASGGLGSGRRRSRSRSRSRSGSARYRRSRSRNRIS
ncbi:hypothetical protein ACJX0J_026881, partial [Zea mays]